MEAIAEILSRACEEGSENVLTLEDIKRWLTDYLQMHAEEIERFPSEKDLPHWDLLAAGYDSDHAAMFLFAFFSGEDVAFVAGRGNISDIRDFGERTFPKNPEGVVAEFCSRFGDTIDRTVRLDELRRWLST